MIGTVKAMMTAAEDLIRRHEAIAVIYNEMKKTFTPARKNAMKHDIDLLKQLPGVETTAAVHSHWFNASGWWLCNNCGGRSGGWKTTPFCPHCGAKMDELMDAEIE
jgi:rubrerythrin